MSSMAFLLFHMSVGGHFGLSVQSIHEITDKGTQEIVPSLTWEQHLQGLEGLKQKCCQEFHNSTWEKESVSSEKRMKEAWPLSTEETSTACTGRRYILEWLNAMLQFAEFCQVSQNGIFFFTAHKKHCTVFIIRDYSFYT